MRRLSILRVSAGAELATGIGLMAAPSIVTELLLGSGASEQESVLARVLGGGLVSLAVAGLVSGDDPANRGVLAGFTSYNGLMAFILGLAGARRTAHGVLLWPAVAEHGGVAVVLLVHALSRQARTVGARTA
jgi:hypothetical protein